MPKRFIVLTTLSIISVSAATIFLKQHSGVDKSTKGQFVQIAQLPRANVTSDHNTNTQVSSGAEQTAQEVIQPTLTKNSESQTETPAHATELEPDYLDTKEKVCNDFFRFKWPGTCDGGSWKCYQALLIKDYGSWLIPYETAKAEYESIIPTYPNPCSAYMAKTGKDLTTIDE